MSVEIAADRPIKPRLQKNAYFPQSPHNLHPTKKETAKATTKSTGNHPSDEFHATHSTPLPSGFAALPARSLAAEKKHHPDKATALPG